MGNIICISSQKGGVGKTTIAVNLASALAIAEKKTLLIDLDFQGHATSSLGIDKKKLGKCLYDSFIQGTDLDELIMESGINYLKIIPSGTNLLKAEYGLKTTRQKETILKEMLSNYSEEFSYFIIDCPPSLNLMAVNGINAADSVLIPLQCEYLALESLGQYLKIFNCLKETYNTHTEICGIILNMYNSQEDISRQIAKDLKEKFNGMVFNTKIPRSQNIRESACYGKSILLSDISSEEAKTFINLAREIMGRNNTQE